MKLIKVILNVLDIDYCFNNLCVYGICIDIGVIYSCICDVGWIGLNCS